MRAAAQRAMVDQVLGNASGAELLLGVPFFLASIGEGNAATRAPTRC